METLESVIAAHPFWHGLDPAAVARLAEAAQRQCHGMGELIFREGQAASHLYLLHRGRVALETFVPGRGVVILQTLGCGEALGWSWLFPPYRWQGSARSLDTTETIAFSAECLRALAEEQPAFGRELVTRMSRVLFDRLQAARQLLQEFGEPAVGKGLDECLKPAPEQPDPQGPPGGDR